MSTDAKATGYLELNISGFDEALKTAKRLMVGFVGVFSAYKLEQFFVGGVKGAIDFGKEMQSASRAMGGFDPGQLLLTQKALEKTGMGAEEARGHIGDFIKEGRHLSDLFVGKGDLGNALRSASEEYGKQAEVLSRSGAKLQSVWNTIESVSSKVKTFFLSMTEQFLGPMQTLLDYLNQIDLSGMGADFGKAIGDAVTVLTGALKNGDLTEIMKLGLTLAFQDSVNWLIGGLKFCADYAKNTIKPKLIEAYEESIKTLTDAYDKSVKYLTDKWKLMCDDEILQGITGALVKGWGNAGSAVYTKITEWTEYLRSRIYWAFIQGMQGIKKTSMEGPWNTAKGFAEHQKRIFGDSVAMVGGLFGKIGHLYGKAIHAEIDTAKQIGKDIKNVHSQEDAAKSPIVRWDTGHYISGLYDKLGKWGEGYGAKGMPHIISWLKDQSAGLHGLFASWMGKFGSATDKLKTIFEKGSAFDTGETSKKLAELLAKAGVTGDALNDTSRKKHAGDEKLAKNALSNFGGSSSHVIADSLARVGGGGNYMFVGQSLAQKQVQLAERNAKASEEARDELKKANERAEGASLAPSGLER